MKDDFKKSATFKAFKCSVILICLFAAIFLGWHAVEGWRLFLVAAIIFSMDGTINIGSSDKNKDKDKDKKS